MTSETEILVHWNNYMNTNLNVDSPSGQRLIFSNVTIDYHGKFNAHVYQVGMSSHK